MRTLSRRAALASAILLAAAAWPASAFAKEYPIGKPVHKYGMEVAAVYLQPIVMAPPHMMRPASKSDIHLEADIHADAHNVNGFAEGDWMPYLVVHYELTKLGTKQTIEGDLMPMVAKDGPHYGANVKLMGYGKYKLTLAIAPPSANPKVPFGRHIDKDTGVAPWFPKFKANFDFVWAGVGKKGAY